MEGKSKMPVILFFLAMLVAVMEACQYAWVMSWKHKTAVTILMATSSLLVVIGTVAYIAYRTYF